jgi:hypothetical protein
VAGRPRSDDTRRWFLTATARPNRVAITKMTSVEFDQEQNQATIVELLAGPPGVEDVELEVPASRAVAEPAGFD